MKKFFHCALLFALTTLIFLTATAHAEPVKIARVPIIFQCNAPDAKICAALETKIERAIHIPLNGYLQVAEYLPPEESARVLGEIWQEMSTDKKTKLADAMRPLADALDADIVVCPILQNFSQYIVGFSGWYSDEILDSYAAVELIVYDRRTDELVDKKASRMHHDTMSGLGTAFHLATVCFDTVIAETKLKERIRAIGRTD